MRNYLAWRGVIETTLDSRSLSSASSTGSNISATESDQALVPADRDAAEQGNHGIWSTGLVTEPARLS